jgi:hypothetical protein
MAHHGSIAAIRSVAVKYLNDLHDISFALFNLAPGSSCHFADRSQPVAELIRLR